MNRRYDLHVSLYLKAPLISSGGEDAARGIDRKFYRDATGKFVLQGSHIKGKLKEAIRELLTLKMWTENDLNKWFGPDSDDDPDHLQRGHLCFSDFMLKQSEAPPADHTWTRVAIDKQTGTSRENFLQIIETLFPSGATTKWQGQISFFAADESAAQAIREKLLTGFCWITALGGANPTSAL